MKWPSANDRTPSPSARNPTEVFTILSVSPLAEDHSSLQDILGGRRLLKVHDLVSALALLQQHDIGVVLCERNLQPGTYIDMLDQLHALRSAPSLIVTSRLADEYLWAEALNLGAWDVLAKPFYATEVNRIIGSALQHWQGRCELHTKPGRTVLAAAGM